MDARTAQVRVRVRRQTKEAYQAYVNLQGTTISQDLSAYMERRAVQPLLAAAEGPDDAAE